MTTQEINYTGRKAKVGGICFDQNGRIHVFVGYCDHHGKVMMRFEEAEQFANKYHQQKKRITFRIYKRTVKKLMA